MSTTESRGAGGLVIGKRNPSGSTLVRCDAPFPFSTPVDARSGRILARDPVGFPHVVLLRCPEGTLPEAGKLRLMKAFSLAVEKVRETGKWRGARARIAITVDPAASGDPQCSSGPAFVLPARWLAARNGSLADLRGAVLSLVEGSVEHLEERKEPPAGRREARAKVLLFKNIFTKDVDTGDARQINPGVHYLVSSLLSASVRVILLDGKIPLQDVCARPPDVDAPLSPDQFLDDVDELERALEAHPDLDLVCLTLLERSFGQVRHLARFIRQRSRALIACGGVFPTVTPEHCFAHLGDVDIIVRGDGERILPRIVEAVAAAHEEPVVEALAGLEGVIARCGETTVSARLDSVNRVMDLDESQLDYSFFERQNVEHGLSLSTSRGCIYSCRFCSVMDKKLWRARSVDAVMRDLDAYSARLVEIYGSDEEVPSSARRLQIWDDDFFLDPRRASALLARMTGAGFTTTFVQGTVSSFFVKEGRRITDKIDEELLDSIPLQFFTDV
ncbi:MAG: cobalamin-dependent protein, partial [Deltaproteobacteria bacterium]|nr:cobalamin-dependent protein [Deltaproteobacteria bacterium]